MKSPEVCEERVREGFVVSSSLAASQETAAVSPCWFIAKVTGDVESDGENGTVLTVMSWVVLVTLVKDGA